MAPHFTRICLINPPSAFLLDERVFVNLGLLKVAAVLEAAGCTVDFVDLSGVQNYLDVLEHYCSGTTHDVVGLTATTPQLPAVMKVREVLRNRWPQARLILGGPHTTLMYAARKVEQKRGTVGGRGARGVDLLETAFDVLCAGDGESAIFAAMAKAPPKYIDGDDHHSPLFMSNADYEASPLPARHLIDMKSYRYQIEGRPATNLIAQLGCPFNCGFCGGRNSRSLRLIRTRSSESVVQEIEFLHREYGYCGFMFYDDELNVNPRLVELMDQLTALQERLGVEFRLRGFIKAELFSDAQAAAMYRAGFRWLLCGFEAAAPRILTNIDKRATLDDNNRAMAIARRHGLKVKALMSMGHPGDSEETALAIRDWLIGHRVDDFDVTLITPYPGTPYHDLAVPHDSLPDVWTYSHPKTGDRLHARTVDYAVTADYYKGIPGGGYQSFVFTDYLSSDQLVSLRDRIEAEVRQALNIPFNQASSSVFFEHSMGQGPSLPDSILRQARPEAVVAL
ncbi:hypothetical protein ABAC460_19840 [Asticcacaulis sp. AC460]|uniref:B12-binding domain-containing radical SAM protein n=1 Tax=Asticcacaulis sp. AC460 TaxID=1282360 RepID=UPI0003C412B5|nr:radical SAM protein [Asticcacaulis sp. AC460]ESQ87277.1 hypothetical protein ABAC460_19840 [Asticcacaulis sp. AC460]